MLAENTSKDITTWLAFFAWKDRTRNHLGNAPAQETPSEARTGRAFKKPEPAGSLDELKRVTDLV